MKKISEGIIRVVFFLLIVMFFAGSASAEQWAKTTPADIPAIVDLTGVWTISSITAGTWPDNVETDIFCTGLDGEIIHYDGTDWESMASGAVVDLNAIWGSSDDDIFAVGNNATILHYNGNLWSSQLSIGNDLNAIWGSSASNVYAVGNGGTILRYNGIAWSAMESDTNFNLNAVWGSSANDIFAVGEFFTILHYDGTEWSAFETTSVQDITLSGIWGYASNSVFAVGESGTIAWYNGNVWTLVSSELSTNINLNAIWGASACNIFAAGSVLGSAAIYHFDGSEWSSQASIIPDNTQPLLGIYGSSMRNIFAVGEEASGATFLSYIPEGDEEYPLICATSPANNALDISPSTDIYALFSTEMDPDTITAATFTLTTGNDTISGTVSYEAGGFAVFTPDKDLSYATTYVATISTGVEDPFEYAIASEYTWGFTTSTILLDDSDSKGCFISSARAE